MAAVDAVELLRRQFLQLIDPEQLALPAPDALRLPDTQKQIYERIFDESTSSHGPPERYKFRVLKRLVGAIENSIEDLDEDVGFFFLIANKLLFYQHEITRIKLHHALSLLQKKKKKKKKKKR